MTGEGPVEPALDLAKLERLAAGATSGERTFVPSTSYRVGRGTRHVGPLVIAVAGQAHGGQTMRFQGSTTTEDADAAYIAALDPDAIRALIAKAREADRCGRRVAELERLICAFAREWGGEDAATNEGRLDADARFNTAAYRLFEAVDCAARALVEPRP